MGNGIVRVKQLILLVGDLICMYLALVTALMARYHTLDLSGYWQTHRLSFGILFALWLIVLFINNVYDIRRAKNTILFFQNISLTFLTNFFLGLAFFYFIPAFRITPKTNLILVVILALLLVSFWRALFNWLLGPSLLKRSILFLGYHPRLEELVTLFGNDPQIGYRVAAIVDPVHDQIPPNVRTAVECFSDPLRIRAVVDIKDVHLVVISPSFARSPELEKELYELLFWRIEMADLASFYEAITGRVDTSMLSESWFLQNLRESRKQYYDAARTVFDLVAAVLLGIAFIAMFPFVALAVLLESGRPLFIKQARMGYNNRVFTIYKLRTMYAQNPDGMAERGAPQFAQANDRRITRVGRWLRRFRIDELPQVWNVLRRDMNIIGPRPERPEFVEQLQERVPFYSIRHLLRPGITGWAQVNYRYGATLEESLVKLEYDLFYMKNRSLLIDAVVMLKTIHIIVKAMGR
ncbi:MAG: exopolysaccharide biosynthesis polyprenyl glycosylphosphotransferase [Patescibacteria group bacterium]